MQVEAAKKDIRRFVSLRFINGISRSRMISSDIRKNEKLKKTIIDTISERADNI